MDEEQTEVDKIFRNKQNRQNHRQFWDQSLVYHEVCYFTGRA